MEKVLVIVGQTAVGKTAMSIKLAKALNGEIINGDAMQVYKELNIVTDKIKIINFLRAITKIPPFLITI